MSSETFKGWIGVDLDGTLAEYTTWVGPTYIGRPVQVMLDRVKAWRKEGKEVRIFTARIAPINDCVMPRGMLTFQPRTPRDREAVAALRATQEWCKVNVGEVLPVTNVKDYGMYELWDDRCIQVKSNSGLTVAEAYEQRIKNDYVRRGVRTTKMPDSMKLK